MNTELHNDLFSFNNKQISHFVYENIFAWLSVTSFVSFFRGGAQSLLKNPVFWHFIQIKSSCISNFLLPSHSFEPSALLAFGFWQMHLLNKYWKVLETFKIGKAAQWHQFLKVFFGCWIKNAFLFKVSFHIFCFYLEIGILKLSFRSDNPTRKIEVSNKYMR